MTLGDLLTPAGATAIVLIITQVLKTTWPNFDASRFGALTAIIVGIIVVVLANAASIADIRLDWGTAVLTGFLSGAAAAGLFGAAKGVTSTASA